MIRLSALVLACVLAGCGPQVKRETSSDMTENGVVIDNLHSMPHVHHDTNLGFTTGGDLSITPSTTRIPETYGVVFRCDHNMKFAVQGTGDRYKQLFDKLDPGMKVVIVFREVWDVTYEDEQEIGREFVDFDFIDANPVVEKEDD